MHKIDDTIWEADIYQDAILDFFEEFKSRPSLMNSLQLLIQTQPALQNGDHYWRPISENGTDFHFADLDNGHVTGVVAWSRIIDDKEVICAINLDSQEPAAVYVTIDDELHPTGGKCQCLYASEPSPEELNVEVRNGKCIRMTIPARGLVIYG